MSSSPSFPLHRLVWENRYDELDRILGTGMESRKEEEDPHGRTPLMLAVTLGHLESTKVLLKHETNVNVVNPDGWTVVQEAVATGDPELLQAVLQRRDKQRYSSRIGGIPELLQRLKNAPDFYVEMKWEFTSWVPLLSRMCPSDVYKVYKQGSNVRVDTSLLGFDQSSWLRGNRTYVFKGHENGADLLEIDHDSKTVYAEEMKILSLSDLESYRHTEEQISARLTTPLVLTYVDTEKINFERTKSGGIWGWRSSDRSEVVNGYDCKVFSANNVELITKTRTEHLTEEDKQRSRKKDSSINPLQSFLGYAETEEEAETETATRSSNNGSYNPRNITMEDYFKTENPQGEIGRPKELTSKVQKFKASLWLSEDFPLSLQEQIMPIVDLMAISNTHFQKLKDFITCSFPAGFPVKIEIPLFHVLNARITFGNIFGMDNPVEGITIIKEEEVVEEDNYKTRLTAVVDDLVFAIPKDYIRIGGRSSDQMRRQYDDDDQLLQYAIRQSIREDIIEDEEDDDEEEVDIYQALQAHQPQSRIADKVMDIHIQRAIEASLSSSSTFPNGASNIDDVDDDLAIAIALSQKEQEKKAKKEAEEEELLAKVLELSLTEK